jgi:tetratricopeptide (TPR) repeat protein
MARYDESIKVLKLSLRIFRRTEVTSRGERLPGMGVGQSLHSMGRCLRKQGKFEETLERLEEAHGIYKEALGEEHASVASVLCDMGNVYLQLGQDDKALEIYHESLRIFRLAQDDDRMVEPLVNIGCILMSQDMLVEARASLEEALEILRRLHSDKHLNVALVLHHIGTILAKQGEHDEALKLMGRGLKIYRRALGDAHEEVGKSLMMIGTTYHGQGKYDEAVRIYEEALDVYTRALGIDNERNANVHDSISRARYESGDLSGALESAGESVRIYNKLGTANRVATSIARDSAEWLRKLEGEM